VACVAGEARRAAASWAGGLRGPRWQAERDGELGPGKELGLPLVWAGIWGLGFVLGSFSIYFPF